MATSFFGGAFFGGEFFNVGGASAAISGTIIAATETNIVSGGRTILITLSGDTWVAAGATFDAERQGIINGLDSGSAGAFGWDAVVKAGLAVTAVARTSATVVTVTLSAFPTYNITANETITVTVPGSALVGAVQLVGSPTFTITAGPEDTHDGGPKREYEVSDDENERRRKVREDAEQLRSDLLAAVASATRKPPPLDASPKQLAAIARKSEGFDYGAALAEMERIRDEERAIAALATSREEYIAFQEQRTRIRRQEEEALLLLLLH